MLEDKVALVTGGGGDIGRAIAIALADEGVRVAICGRSQPTLLETANAIKPTENCIPIVADVSSPRDVQRMIRKVFDEWRRLDILVNNAGVVSFSSVVDLPDEEWSKTIDVNLTGTFLCSKYAAKEMIKQGKGGRIINISSRAGKVGMKDTAHYSASKFGVIGFTQSLALELAPYGITVNSVCPARIAGKMARVEIISTARTQSISEDQAEEEYASPIPLGRLGLASEVANLIVFLCTEKASYILGESVNISGGLDLVRGGQ